MKGIKKLISINFIIIFILSMINLNQISFASNQNIQNQGVINVTNIENGATVTLYQIATMEFDDDANQPREGYNWTPNVYSWLKDNLPEYSNVKEFYKNVENNSEKANEFYDKITSAIKQGKLSLPIYMQEKAEGEAKYPITEENLTGNVEFSNVEMGTYIAIIENGYMIYNPSVVNVIPKVQEETNNWVLEEQNVIIKACKPTITKSVTNLNQFSDNYSTSDSVFYMIQADVPKYLENSISKEYMIQDEMDKSLKINGQKMLLFGYRQKDADVAEAISDYTLDVQETSDKRIYKINFDYNDISNYEAIRIIYYAQLTKDSNLVIGKNGNNNYAYLYYSNNPYLASNEQVQLSKTTVYTYDMKVKVVDKDDGNIGLAGSEFNIEAEDGSKLYFVKGNDGEYYVSKQEEENSLTTLVVNENGELKIKGLDEGTYNVKQTKASNGYFISAKSYKINIKDSNLDGVLEEENSITFFNSKIFTLPVTGGNGIVMLIGLGTILIGIGIALIVSINKKRKILKNN